MKIKEYAVLDVNIDLVTGNNLENPYDAEIIFESQDKNEIEKYLRESGRDLDDDNTTIEDYYVNEDGEFLEGSNYDIPTNFIKNIDKR